MIIIIQLKKLILIILRLKRREERKMIKEATTKKVVWVFLWGPRRERYPLVLALGLEAGAGASWIWKLELCAGRLGC